MGMQPDSCTFHALYLPQLTTSSQAAWKCYTKHWIPGSSNTSGNGIFTKQRDRYLRQRSR